MTPALRDLFTTQIYQTSLTGDRGFAPFIDELKAACLMLATEDAAGRAWCRANGYRGYTSYASLADLPRRATVFTDLKRKLDGHAARYADALRFDLGGRRLKLDSLWVNVLDAGGATAGIFIPTASCPARFMWETPPGAGALRLEDPRLPLMMAAPQRAADAPEPQQRFVYLSPTPGTVLIWESWLRHEVMANKARERRISLSFNYA